MGNFEQKIEPRPTSFVDSNPILNLIIGRKRDLVRPILPKSMLPYPARGSPITKADKDEIDLLLHSFQRNVPLIGGERKYIRR